MANSLTKPWHGLPVWAWLAGGGVLAGLAYYMYTQHQASSAVTSGSGTSTSAPSAGYSSTGGYPSYGSPATTVVPSGLQTSELLQLLQDMQGLKSTPTTTPTSTPTATPTSKQPGYGIIQTAKGPMVILGQETGTGPVAFSGYNVGGGAPVYYGNTKNLVQGLSQATPGNYVYTPASFGSFVSSTTHPAA